MATSPPPLPDGVQEAPPQASNASSPPPLPAGVTEAPASPSVGGFLQNTLSSAGRFAGDTAHAIAHPLDTIGALSSTVEGGLDKALGLPNQSPYFDAFTQHVSDRYGSIDKLKNTMYQDPVGVLADLSTVADGVGSLADIGKLSTVSDVAKTVSGLTNPAALAGSVISKAASPLGDAVAQGLVKSGLKGGYQVTTDSKNLGAAVGNSANAMLDNKIAFSPQGLQDLQKTLGDLQQQKNKLTMGATQGAGAAIDPKVVVQNLQDLRNKWETQAYPKNDLKQIDSVIADFQSRHPAPIGLDEAEALKEGTYANNKYANGAPPPHLAATAASEQNIAHTLMTELQNQLPELNNLNSQQAALLNLEPMLQTALTKYNNTGGFLPNAWRNLTSLKGGIVDAMAGGLGLGLSHDPATASIAGGSAALINAVLSDPAVKTRLALAIKLGQKAPAGTLTGPVKIARTAGAYAPADLPGDQQQQ